MGYKNREIETKFRVNSKFSTLEVSLDKLLENKSIKKITGKSKDVYWKALRRSEADFVRVRFLPEGGGQLTLKQCDRNIQDRKEIDVDVDDPQQAIELLEHLMGNPTGEVVKKYVVYFLDHKDTNVSLYKVAEDDAVFIEVEARTKSKMMEVIQMLEQGLNLNLSKVNKSIFDMYIKG